MAGEDIFTRFQCPLSQDMFGWVFQVVYFDDHPNDWIG